jgi:hypothetical protein
MGILYASKHRRYRQHANTSCARSFARGRFALCWTGLDWSSLVWLGSGPRISNSSTLARTIANDVLHPGLLRTRVKQHFSGRRKLTNVPRSHQKDHPALCFHTRISDTTLSGIHMQQHARLGRLRRICIHAAPVFYRIMKGPLMVTLSEPAVIINPHAKRTWVYMPTPDVQEPCACRTSQGFSYACSHQAARLTSPRGCSRSRNHRALLTFTSDPICYIRLDAAHRVHPVLSQLPPARAKNVDLHRDLLGIKQYAAAKPHVFPGTSGCFTRQEIIPNIPNTPINRPANSRFWPGPEFDRPSITETDNYQYIFNKGTSAERNIRMVRTGRLPHAAT